MLCSFFCIYLILIGLYHTSSMCLLLLNVKHFVLKDWIHLIAVNGGWWILYLLPILIVIILTHNLDIYLIYIYHYGTKFIISSHSYESSTNLSKLLLCCYRKHFNRCKDSIETKRFFIPYSDNDNHFIKLVYDHWST